MKTATATNKGVEIMGMIRRGHCRTCKRGAKNEVHFVNPLSASPRNHETPTSGHNLLAAS